MLTYTVNENKRQILEYEQNIYTYASTWFWLRHTVKIVMKLHSFQKILFYKPQAMNILVLEFCSY